MTFLFYFYGFITVNYKARNQEKMYNLQTLSVIFCLEADLFNNSLELC